MAPIPRLHATHPPVAAPKFHRTLTGVCKAAVERGRVTHGVELFNNFDVTMLRCKK
jgi:hypothetical protein